jgi:hypothetical protein
MQHDCTGTYDCSDSDPHVLDDGGPNPDEALGPDPDTAGDVHPWGEMNVVPHLSVVLDDDP